jgi:hypothetical protein
MSVVVALCLGGLILQEARPAVVQAAAESGRFVPREPLRVLDSRTGVGMPAHKLVATETVTLQFDPASGVPDDATAVAINITATDTDGPGFVSVWPSGSARPTVSNLNVTRSGQTLANFAIVPLGPNRSIDLFTYAGTHLVVDYSGFWVPAAASAAGRYLAVTPARVLDTRSAGNRPADGGIVDVQIAGRAGVPADATAAVVGVTAVGAARPAFVTVWPAGSDRPLASTLNVSGSDPVANMALVPLGPGGRVSLFAQNSVDLIVDVQGYVTGAAATSSAAGLFVPLPPARVADSRDNLGLARMGAFFDQELALAGFGGVPTDGVSAVAANFTVTETRAPGFLSVYPSRTQRPLVSTLNFTAGSTVAAFGLPKVGTNGLGMVTMKQADVIVDVSGYFLGEPVAAVTPPPIKCSDLMIYDYAPEGIDNANDYELRVRDLSGNHPDRTLVDPSIFFRIAPGCQYVIVARESIRFPGSLALYRYDSVLQPTEPTVISDDLPWLGASITDNAEWIYLYVGWILVDGVQQDAVVALNAWTGEERLVMATPDLDYVVGTMSIPITNPPQHNRPAVLVPATNAPQQLRLATCRYSVYFVYGAVPISPCIVHSGLDSVDMDEADVLGGRAAAYVDRSGVGHVFVWSVRSYATTLPSGISYAVGGGLYHPRLAWDLSPVFSDGSAVRMYKGFPPLGTWPGAPAPTGTFLLDTTNSDYPEFSRPLLRVVVDPPELTNSCAFTIFGC